MEYEKTRKMRRAERAIGRPLELAMPEAYEKCGTIGAAAEELDIPKETFRWWMRKLGITLRRKLVTR
jgi:hypothetical protein